MTDQDMSASLVANAASSALVSVVVSTCNRSGNLPQLFDALVRQRVPPSLRWELILVDNRSTDATAEVTREFARRAPFPVSYLFEGRQGKSYGVNTGIAAASGSIVAFTDDDGVPAEDWLARIVEHFERLPDSHCLGGRVELFDPRDAMVSLILETEYRVLDVNTFSARQVPVIGCNIAMRADMLRILGPYDVLLGPGSKVGVAEDLDFLYRVVLAGFRIHYDPLVLVLHNHGRRTDEQIGNLMKAYRLGRGAFYCKFILRRDHRVMRWVYWDCLSLARRILRHAIIGREARDEWRILWLLLVGAVRYVRLRGTVAGGPTDSSMREGTV